MQNLDYNLLLTQVRVDQMFRIIRELNDLTLKDVAVETGHVVSTISKFENCKIKSDELVDFYSKLANQAGVLIDRRPLEESEEYEDEEYEYKPDKNFKPIISEEDFEELEENIKDIERELFFINY